MTDMRIWPRIRCILNFIFKLVIKSTLANALVGEKIAIVSHKPQTTRNRICAIVDRGDTQLVFIDTPGFHRPRTKLGDYMVNIVNQSVADVDAVILLVEPIANVGPQEQELIEKIKEAKVPAILVINKIDTVEKETLLPVIAAYKDLLDFTDVIPISAKWHDGLDSLMQVCENFAQPGPFMFPEGISTDMPEKQVMAEIIREKLLWNLEKGIIIGKNGQMLKKISTDARKDCERFMGTKVFLQTWVRVKENWRDSDYMISNFGYHKES